jgi:hypothetical protein
MRAAVVIAVVGVILAGGCSDDESSNPTSGPPTTGSTKTDQQIADDAVWLASDMPADWGPYPEGDLDNNENLLEECAAEDPTSALDDGDPRAFSAWWAPEGEGGFADTKVEINPDVAQVEATLDALRTPEGQDCLADALTSALTGPGQEAGDVELVERDSEGLGDDAIVYRAAVPLSGEGYDIYWFSDLVTIRQGRALVQMTFGHQDGPIPPAEQQRLTEIVLERLQADL